MGPWGDGAPHCGVATTAATWTALVTASSSGALGLGVQRQRISGGRPLVQRPRHLRPHDDVAAAGQPLLRWKWPELVAGVFPFSAAKNLRIGTMCVVSSDEAREKKRAEQEGMSDEGSAPSSFIAGEG